MNNAVRERLFKALNDLLEKDFDEFKWWLKGIDHNGKPNIPAASLEKANQREVVDFLIQYYGEEAPKMCIRALQKTNMYDVARKLEETLQKGKKIEHITERFSHVRSTENKHQL